jgi:hypothetical protein
VRRRRVAEVLDPEHDAVRLDRRHHASPVAATPPDVRNEWTIGHIVTSRARYVGVPASLAPLPERDLDAHRPEKGDIS